MRNTSEGDLRDQLEVVLELVERVPRRFTAIEKAADFLRSVEGIDRMDAISMALLAAGESLKQIDRNTDRQYLSQYPEVPWRGIIGLREVLAHGYPDIDATQLFEICKAHVPLLISTLRKMLDDLPKA